MVERQVAIKATIADLLSGEYVQKEGWTPNFVRTRRGPVSRVNVMGVLIQEPEPNVFVLDDGSGQVRVRTFDKVANAKVGDAVLVIGRPRKYANQLFINYEILRSINPAWLGYRKEELEHLGAFLENTPAPSIQKNTNATKKEVLEDTNSDTGQITIADLDENQDETVVLSSENVFMKVLDIIRALDKENKNAGAEHDKVLAACEHKEAPSVLTSLLEEGEVFEIRPGLLKVLE